MFIQNTLIDNSEHFMLANYLKEMLGKEEYRRLRIATGFWDLAGMKVIEKELTAYFERGGILDLLIGQEPQLRSYQMRSDLTKEEKFPDFYIHRDIEKLSEEYQPVVRLLLKYTNPDDDLQSQVRIRIYGQDGEEKRFLHAKCYIFTGYGVAHGIIGSSNFTEKGLQGNAELNYLETNPAIVTAVQSEYNYSKSHLTWFEEMWAQSVPWTGKFIKEILAPSPIGKKTVEAIKKEEASLSPYELYIKLLQTEFGPLVERNAGQAIDTYLPEGYSRLEYQMTAVKQCFSIMKTHGGFMLGDVVGLGKTIVGTMVIRYFLDYPDEGHEKRILIVTPPAIKSAWVSTIEEFDKGKSDKIMNYVDFITTGSIGNILEDATDFDDEDDYDDGSFTTELKSVNYGLIIIDESHKFRNSQTLMYQSLDGLISQIGANTGSYPYVGLLSATLQNNAPDDLKNQLYLFERNHEYCSLEKVESRNLEGFFSRISHSYRDARHRADDIIANPDNYPDPKYAMDNVNRDIKEIAQKIRECILDDILVRRTRTDVKKYYEKDMVAQNIKFPTISGPHSLKYVMGDDLAQLFVDTMNVIAPSRSFGFDDSQYLCYYRYRTIQFFSDPAVVKMYQGGNIDAERYSRQLAKIMQINLVKRLESSFAAFKSSLRNLRHYTQNMIEMWENDTIFVCPNIDVNAELDVRKLRKKNPSAPILSFQQCVEDVRAKIKKLNDEGRNEKGRNAEYKKTDFKPEYIELVRKDLALVNDLCERWAEYDADPKLERFKEAINDELLNPEQNPSGKLVIFSEAKDTVVALKRTLDNKGFKGRVLVIDASNRDKLEKTIQENFDANYKGEKKEDYQIIITTEVLAEGINLHRANVILNYDTPWNSTKLMQRIGRVNRIGTTADTVYVYNFLPSAQGNAMIQLVQKAYIKLQSFHVLFGEDSKIFTEDEEVKNYDLNTAVNGEESPLEKYVHLLRQFRYTNPARYDFIKGTEENLMQAVKPDGTSYFLIKTPTMKGLFVKVVPGMNGKVIPAIEMFKEFPVEEGSVSISLPENWTETCTAAIKAFGQHLSKMNYAASRNKPATKAKGIIDSLINNPNLPEKSKNLLIAADGLVRKGNTDIIRKVISIGEALSSQDVLFAMSQDEIDHIVSTAIEKIVEDQRRINGKPFVYIGLAK